MMEYRQRLYDAIKAYGGEWVNVDELCQDIKLNRKDLIYTFSCIREHKDFPGLRRKSKRSTEKMAFGVQKAVYNISYKCEV